MPKATRAQIEERVTVVYRMVLKGAMRGDILRHGSEAWSLTPRQVEDYLARATERFKALAAFVREEELGKTRARLEELYRRNLEADDLKEAHAVVSDTADLLGLYAPKQTRNEHSGPGGGPIEVERVMPDAELEARLRLALEARGEGPALPALAPAPSGAD